MNDARRDTPSFHRNIEPITDLLQVIIRNREAAVLEIASGSGQHVAHFGQAFPNMTFQPTEYEADALPSIDAWTEDTRNVLSASQLDVTKAQWFGNDLPRFDVLFCSNVVHITPWHVTHALFAGAKRNLRQEAKVILYGPYKVNREFVGENDPEFDLWLKEKDASFGIRDIADVEHEANKNGFKLEASYPMPANNFIQVFNRQQD